MLEIRWRESDRKVDHDRMGPGDESPRWPMNSAERITSACPEPSGCPRSDLLPSGRAAGSSLGLHGAAPAACLLDLARVATNAHARGVDDG